MRKVKEKECDDKDCSNTFVQYSSLKKYCSYECENKNKKQKFGGRKKISPISKKKEEQLSIYRVNRDKYLKDNIFCEVKDCENKSTHIHHKNGRVGKMLYNTEYFMAVCNVCHPEKIHFNPGPKWARENGYLI